VPTRELLAPLGASLNHARAHLQSARASLRGTQVRHPDRIDAALIALDDRISEIHFALESAFYAVRDRAAASRAWMLEISSLPPSTLLAYAAVGVMAAILADDLVRGPQAVPPPSAEIRLQPEWIEIPRAQAAFALNSSTLESVDAHYVVRRHRPGGGRKDELTFGDPGSRRPYVRVVLYRPGAEGIAEPDPLEAVIEVASLSSIDADLQETNHKVATKFGTLPIVAMTVNSASGPRQCIATAAAWSDPRLGLTAWWCNQGAELVAHGDFACLLDRLALMSAGGDDRLAEFFARAELRRRSCGPDGSFVSPTPKRHDDWIYAKAMPRLRGRLSAR
jgi:hypothetical protein